MTDIDETIEFLRQTQNMYDEGGNAYKMLEIVISTVKTVQNVPNDDLISRKVAIEAVTGWDEDPSDEDLECAIMGVPSAQPEIIRCGECKNHIDERCIMANHHTSKKDNCMSVMGAKRREDG